MNSRKRELPFLAGIFGLSMATLVCFCNTARANVVALPGLRYSGDIATSYWDGVEYVQGRDIIDAPSGSRGGASISSAFASYASALSPTPLVTAFASDSAPASPLLITASASVNFNLDYFFEVVGPGAPLTQVPIDISAKGTTLGRAFAMLNIACVGCAYGSTFAAGPTGDWTVNSQFQASLGVVYDVNLAAQVFPLSGDGQAVTDQATATVDPYFAIDPSAANAGYSLAFSPGVSNSPTSAVPEPPTWAFLLFGLASLGVGARRLKRPALERSGGCMSS
jgi:hypothetical protein